MQRWYNDLRTEPKDLFSSHAIVLGLGDYQYHNIFLPMVQTLRDPVKLSLRPAQGAIEYDPVRGYCKQGAWPPLWGAWRAVAMRPE
jgi:hypothetical protein